jgi:ParB-like chromosome segregation protein Spo0J
LKISDLKQDQHNANMGSKRGHDSITHSLKTLGAGRSVLVDKNGVIVAGNKTVNAALKSGIDADAIVVQTDGTKLVVVQRTDLDLTTDSRAKALAIADNRSGQFFEWNPEVIANLANELDLKPYFTDDELAKLLDDGDSTEVSDDQTGELTGTYSVMVECGSEESQLELIERLCAEGFTCRSLIA